MQKKEGTQRTASQNYSPSMKILLRIMKTMLEGNFISKTALSMEANVNYARLAKHLEWLENRGFAEFTAEKGKINFMLTVEGRELASKLSELL